MSVEFKNSETKTNLMRAFAGESQARNRYTFAAEAARKQNLQAIAEVFLFTADQEKEHAGVFYKLLQEMTGENIAIEGDYPVDLSPSVTDLLRKAHDHEYEEYETVYKSFAETAQREGFPKIAATFQMIANVEKTHGDRFAAFADLLENNRLFVSETEECWMCLNCGHVFKGTNVPEKCPVCEHDRGYFIRLSVAPYTEA